MARYYLIAWGFLLAGTLITMLIYLGVIPYHFWTVRSVQVGAVMEVTLLSLGLGYRYNVLRKERERMRLRIASDLHDDIGSGLTQISLYSELALRTPGPKADGWMEQIGTQARSLVERIQDIVWAIQPEEETWEALELRMKDFATGLLGPKNIAFEMQGEAVDDHEELAPNVRQNVLLMFKEIVHNAVRHANCSKVHVRWKVTRDALWLRVCDDGCGFDPSTAQSGHGLKSLRHRAAEIDAQLRIDTAPGEATRVEIEVPLRSAWAMDHRGERNGRLPWSPRDSADRDKHRKTT
jgi:signal transduction histidine kinase